MPVLFSTDPTFGINFFVSGVLVVNSNPRDQQVDAKGGLCQGQDSHPQGLRKCSSVRQCSSIKWENGMTVQLN